MTERLFLGVDGGGTSTRARLTDSIGRTLGEGHDGTSNLTQGIPKAASAILAATAAAFASAGLTSADYARTFAGLGLAGANVPSLADELERHGLPFAAYALASDAVIACLGAHGGRDGAILILGTGSQGFAIVGAKEIAIGGWGFLVSDLGSGAILGRTALRAAVAAVDGLDLDCELSRALMARFGGQPAEAVTWAATASPRDYAAFAPVVLEHFGKGDPLARRLMTQATADVTTQIDRLIAIGADRIALMGGLATVYRPLLPERLARHLVSPGGDAEEGALLLARRAVEKPPTAEATGLASTPQAAAKEPMP
ncbi:MAG: BadF/BadG/BcrA/BcrD ATPase family protein [Ancalomicrobiaceae bacterium]|nr:BadF/BadG/BcrA/BcrD ATPase family protein [Ancalomicrobiaceae bacterium]